MGRIQFGERMRAARSSAITIALVGFLFLTTPLGFRLENFSFDLPFVVRGPAPANGITLIYMDDESHTTLAQPRADAWDRSLHARLIDHLTPLKPRAIAFDIFFDRKTTNDARLLAAVSRAAQAGIPVMLAGAVESQEINGRVTGVRVLQPFQATDDLSAPQAAPPYLWGIPQTGSSESVRRRLAMGDQNAPSMARKLVEALHPKQAIPNDRGRWLNYYGPPGNIPHVSYLGALTSREPQITSMLSNQVVFIGANVGIGFTGGKGTDHFDTPWSLWNDDRYPGVELGATAYLNLAQGNSITRMPSWAQGLLILLVGGVLPILLAQFRASLAVGTGLALMILTTASALILHTFGHIWFSWLVIVAVQIPLAIVWAVVADARSLRVENERLKTSGGFDATTEQVVTPNPNRTRVVTPTNVVQNIPDHVLLKRVGKGAYGEIWLARNAIGTYHAVKVIHRSAFDQEEPYEREFRGVQRFMPISRQHPGLVQILHVGRNDDAGHFYYVMEAADDRRSGQTINPDRYEPASLARELKGGRSLSTQQCLETGIQLSSALRFMHEQGLIHRDIKPANIIFVRRVAKLADIGLVTEISRGDRETSFLGTEGFIAPEGPGKPTADVYSLGMVLYVAWTGLSWSQFPEFPTLGSGQPSRLEEIINKACHAMAAQRYQTAAHLLADLEQAARDGAEQASKETEV
jgi:CHASE2 domain-containing sensor protein